MSKDGSEEEIPSTAEEEIARKRNELLLLSEDGEIPQSVSQLKKSSGKQVL